MCPIHEIQKHDISKQTSKPINNSVHCLILALSYKCSRANNECYLCELCEAPRALCVFLALSNNANIYWNYLNFLLDTNQFLSCSRAEAERKLLTQTYTFDALSPHIFLLMLATAHSFNCERYNCTSAKFYGLCSLLMFAFLICLSFVCLLTLHLTSLSLLHFIVIVVILSG